ncbi:MAG: DUF6364 family protein [Balneola sp.]|jgi:hypothetical protein
MKKKLTLTLEEKVIQEAKAYSDANEISVSQLVENYLKVLIKRSHEGSGNLKIKVSEHSVEYLSENTPLVKKMRGMLENKELTGDERLDYLLEKYG